MSYGTAGSDYSHGIRASCIATTGQRCGSRARQAAGIDAITREGTRDSISKTDCSSEPVHCSDGYCGAARLAYVRRCGCTRGHCEVRFRWSEGQELQEASPTNGVATALECSVDSRGWRVG